MDVTYTRVVCEVRPQKADPNRTRITIGGNRIAYPGDTGTKTGSLESVKLILNDTLSTPNAKFACFDISNFYLGTPLDRPEYVRIKLSDIPQEFIDEYNLTEYEHNNWIYFEIHNGVYGLKQAGKLANDLLTERLSQHGYYQCATTPGLWRHKWRPITFILIVDDFGIKYVDKRHAEHLLHALQEQHYKVTTDWTGSKFAGIDIAWNYSKRTCRLSMKDYIDNLLIKYNHPKPRKPQHAPHAHREIIYGAKEQLLPEADTSPPLDEAGIKRIQGIVGSLLYYARAVDNKLLATLSAISAQQSKATKNTEKAVTQLLDYVATYPNDGITYRASNMILAAHSDASYLTEPNSRSRAGAHIFLTENDPIPRQNDRRNGMGTTKIAYPNGQLHCRWIHSRYHHPTANQNDLDAPTLAPLPRSTRPVQILLGQRLIQHGGLSYQAPSASIPPSSSCNARRVAHALTCLQGCVAMDRLRPKNGATHAPYSGQHSINSQRSQPRKCCSHLLVVVRAPSS
ncbi:hypothetical protein ACHAXH_000792 [Discostella pseudostelligera]